MNKASGGDEIPAELFKILKDDAVKMLHSICSNFEKFSSSHGLEKVNFHSIAKECPNYHTVVLISHSSKDMRKILQAKLQQYVN